MSPSTDTAHALVFVVLLTTDGWEETRLCLESLSRLDYKNYQVVVVDNGSTDRLEDRTRRTFPEVHVLQTGGIVGFSRGNNVGIRYSLARNAAYVWLLNNDTSVDAAALSALVRESEADSQIGITGSVIY